MHSYSLFLGELTAYDRVVLPQVGEVAFVAERRGGFRLCACFVQICFWWVDGGLEGLCRNL